MGTGLFGGKGNGLLWLAENTDLGFQVPKFEIIDTSYYEDFLRQPVLDQFARRIYQRAHPDERGVGTHHKCPKRLEEKCIELFQMFNGTGVAVRSSGVVSEDSDKFSGAGIYESFFIGKNLLFCSRNYNCIYMFTAFYLYSIKRI